MAHYVLPRPLIQECCCHHYPPLATLLHHEVKAGFGVLVVGVQRVSRFSGMGMVEWNTGIVEYWNGGILE